MLLEKLFPPRWKHKNPQVRKRALLSLDPQQEQSQKIFGEVLQNDPELYVRRLAIQKLNNIQQLQSIRESTSESEIHEESTLRLCELLSISNNRRPVSFLKTVLSRVAENRILEYVALHANSEELQLLAMDRVQNESVLEEILNTSTFENNKRRALGRLHSANALKRAVKILKRRDRQLATRAQEMLDQIQIAEAQKVDLQKEFRKTANEFLKLANLCKVSEEWEKYAPRLNELYVRIREQGATLGGHQSDKDVSLSREVETAFTSFEAIFEKLDKAKSALANAIASNVPQTEKPLEFLELTEICKTADRLANEEFPQELVEFDVLNSKMREDVARLEDSWRKEISSVALTSLSGSEMKDLQDLEQRFEGIKSRITARLEECRRLYGYTKLLTDINERAKKILDETGKNTDYDSLSKLLREYRALKDPQNALFSLDLRTERNELQAKLEQKEQEIDNRYELLAEEFTALPENLADALASGRTTTVQQLVNRGRNIIRELPESRLVRLKKQNTLSRFEQLVKESESLLDWRRWSSSNVKEQLIEEVEKLSQETNCNRDNIDYDFSGAAARIADARLRWKQASSGTTDKDRGHWERFDDACNSAFEPCKNYFDKLDQVRDENLSAREKICDDLEQYFAVVSAQEAADTDWKALEKIIRVARQDWQKLGAVNRSERAEINKRFNKVLRDLDQRVRSYREENRRTKKMLISQMEAVLEKLNDNSSGIDVGTDTVKSIQAKWKSVGPAHKDRQLWQTFKSLGDKVFEIRKSEQEKLKAQEADRIKQKNDILEAVFVLADEKEGDISDARARFDQLQTKWNEISLSVKISKLESRYKQACEKFQNRIKQAKHDKLSAIKRQIQINVNCCYQLEALINDCLKGQAGPEMLQNTVLKADQQWSDVHEKSLGFTGSIERRYLQLKNYVEMLINSEQQKLIDLINSLHDAAIRNKDDLCIQLEILANKASPEHSAKRRMELQVQRLASSMTRAGAPNIQHEMQQIISQWHTSGFILLPESSDYERRFYSALELLDKDYQYPG